MQQNSDNILSQIKQQTKRDTTVYEKIIVPFMMHCIGKAQWGNG